MFLSSINAQTPLDMRQSVPQFISGNLVREVGTVRLLVCSLFLK